MMPTYPLPVTLLTFAPVLNVTVAVSVQPVFHTLVGCATLTVAFGRNGALLPGKRSPSTLANAPVTVTGASPLTVIAKVCLPLPRPAAAFANGIVALALPATLSLTEGAAGLPSISSCATT